MSGYSEVSDVRITLRNETRQVLGQNMQLSMKFLQMSTQELGAYLRELALENPLLEETPPALIYTPMRQRFTGYRSKEPSDGGFRDELAADNRHDTLRHSVREQILPMRVPELMRRELLYLSGEMDERGYLPEDCGDLAVFGGSWERYEDAVKVFQSLEPAGVGARSLSECLCIQLRRRGCEDELAYEICRSQLERLARGQLNYIANELGVGRSNVETAKKLIASLEPRPSNGFAGDEAPSYVLPDVEVAETEDGFEILAADKYVATYGVDSYYAAMAERPELSDEEREYFSAKLQQANWAIYCVERRRSMLLSCTGAVVERQSAFFRDGVSELLPLTMTELADKLGVHPSTVSRAVRGKYLACRWGVYPLSKFFAAEVTGGGTGAGILAKMRELIASEDPAHPLSDRELSEALAKQGYDISRRTVAKYREEAIIPPASARRKR